jgi:hypothetical protein
MINILYFDLYGDDRDPRNSKWSSFDLRGISLESVSDESDFFKISKDPYTPAKGDKYYFLDKVNIPRVKLKEFHDENGTRTVRDLTQATHVFIGDKTEELYVERAYRYSMPTNLFKKFVELHTDCFDKMIIEDIRQALEFYTEDTIQINYQGARLFVDTSLPHYSELMKHPEFHSDDFQYSKTRYYIKKEYLPIYDQIKDITLCHESCLASVLNGTNAAVIDEEMFVRLSAMFESGDKDNHVLAMEIIANSKYEESLYYIELLFKEYNDVMYNTPTKRHVNFKSLVTYLDKGTYLNTSLDDVVKSLINKQVLTHAMLIDLMHRYKKQIIDGGESQYFAIKDITVTKEIHEIVNKNFTYNLVEDFIPTVGEVVTPEEDIIPEDFLTYNPTDEEETFTELGEEPVDEIEEVEEVEEELPGTEIEAEIESVFEIEEEIVEPKKEEDESEIDWF